MFAGKDILKKNNFFLKKDDPIQGVFALTGSTWISPIDLAV